MDKKVPEEIQLGEVLKLDYDSDYETVYMYISPMSNKPVHVLEFSLEKIEENPEYSPF